MHPVELEVCVVLLSQSHMHPVELEVRGPPESYTCIRWSLKCVVLLSHTHASGGA